MSRIIGPFSTPWVVLPSAHSIRRYAFRLPKSLEEMVAAAEVQAEDGQGNPVPVASGTFVAQLRHVGPGDRDLFMNSHYAELPFYGESQAASGLAIETTTPPVCDRLMTFLYNRGMQDAAGAGLNARARILFWMRLSDLWEALRYEPVFEDYETTPIPTAW